MTPSDLTEAQQEDMLARDRADRLKDALNRYASARHRAMISSCAFGHTGEECDRRAAEGFRADARAALHMFPDLLAMVEGRG